MSRSTANDSRLHVMQASLGMNFGGMERVIIDLYRNMNPKRFRFSVLCLSLRGPLGDEVEADGVPLIVCQNQTRASKYLRGFELGKVLQEQKVDILHTHNTTAFIDGALGASIAGVPARIHTDHSKDYKIEKKRWMVLEHIASRFVDKVVAVSDHTRDELAKYEWISDSKLTVIRNGINPRINAGVTVEALKRDLGLRPGQTVIGTIGRLVPQKGLDLLLDAMPALAAAHPDARLVIVGGGELEPALREQAAALGLGDRVIFTGWRLDAIELLKVFDIFVQVSNFEGLPMVLLEAMSLAKPIVATAVGGVPEAVGHEFNGLLINSRSKNDVSDALGRLVADPTLTRALGQNGRARYEQHFTAQAMAAAYEQLYDQCLEDKRVRIA